MDLLNAGAPDCGGVVERRNWGRLPLALPVFVRGSDERGESFLEFATALNISAGGMLLTPRRVLPMNAQLTVELASAPAISTCYSSRSVRVLKGRVVRDEGHERWRAVALRFSKPLLPPGVL